MVQDLLNVFFITLSDIHTNLHGNVLYTKVRQQAKYTGQLHCSPELN